MSNTTGSQFVTLNTTSPIVIPLCTNRFDLPGTPSTCAIDIIIVPLPSLLFIFALAVAKYQRLLRPLPPSPTVQAPYLSFALPRRPSSISSIVVLFAAILSVLEIALLLSARQGMGLLLLTTAALASASVVMFRLRDGLRKSMLVVFLAYWTGLTACEALKLVRLIQLNSADTKTVEHKTYELLLVNFGLSLISLLLLIEFIRLFRNCRGTQQNGGNAAAPPLPLGFGFTPAVTPQLPQPKPSGSNGRLEPSDELTLKSRWSIYSRDGPSLSV